MNKYKYKYYNLLNGGTSDTQPLILMEGDKPIIEVGKIMEDEK